MLKKFIPQTNSLTGIDVNQKHAHAVELYRLGSNLAVKSYAYNKHIDSINLTKKSIATSIANQDIYFQEIKLQHQLTTAEIEKFLQLNLTKYLPRPAQDLVIDYTVTKNSSETTIQLIAASNKTIQQHINLFKQHNAAHKIIDLNIYALERIVRRQIPINNHIVAAINIDLAQLLIIVIDKYKVLYTHTEHIESINKYALTTKLINILYSVPPQIDRIFLAGQQNVDSAILTIIINKLNLDAKIIDPFFNIKLSKDVDYTIAPALTISCGLALRVNDARWN